MVDLGVGCYQRIWAGLWCFGVVVVMWCEKVKGFGIQEVLFRFAVFAPPLVLFYYGDEHILLVTGGRLFMIWVVVLLQTGVAARVLLWDFVFL